MVENVVMAWRDYKKAYYKTWIIEYLKMFRILEQFINFITKAIENSKVELTAGEQTQVEVKI